MGQMSHIYAPAVKLAASGGRRMLGAHRIMPHGGEFCGILQVKDVYKGTSTSIFELLLSTTSTNTWLRERLIQLTNHPLRQL